jgi:hypothetical protein
MQEPDHSIKNTTVAVCDILGFRSLILENPLRNLLDADFALFRKLLCRSLNQKDLPERPPGLKELRNQDRVGFAWFSDTVLIYAKNDDDDSCQNVIETVQWLVFHTICTRTKIRAGIAYGEFLPDPENELFLGRALVDAYELERSQEWFGAALTPSAVGRLPADIYGWLVCKYDVPLKPKAKRECCGKMAVDWTLGIHDWFDSKWSPEKDLPDDDEDPSLVAKWRNTCSFHDAVCTGCFPKNRRRV